MIIQFHVSSSPQSFVQSSNSCVYCASAGLAVPVTYIAHQIFNGFHVTSIAVPYGTVIDPLLTFHEFASAFTVIVYSFTVSSNFAV